MRVHQTNDPHSEYKLLSYSDIIDVRSEPMKAEEKRIRTSMMGNHKEQENQLQLDLIQHHQLSLNDLQNEIEVRNVHQLKKIRRTAAKHLQQAEQELATELQNEMHNKLNKAK